MVVFLEALILAQKNVYINNFKMGKTRMTHLLLVYAAINRMQPFLSALSDKSQHNLRSPKEKAESHIRKNEL